MPITAAEQYLIELVNRGRLDPLAEAERYNVNLNAGLAPGTIGAAPVQVLSPNATLNDAADLHSDWMLAEDTFSHTGQNGSNPGQRMDRAGYDFVGEWGWAENLAWSGSTGSINMAEAIAGHHEGLYRSPGHRTNTFSEDVREIGVAQVSGSFNMNGADYNASMLTEQFAVSGSDVFVTGVAYRDRDRDDFYSIGEGQSNVWFRHQGSEALTEAAGGYGLNVGTATTATIEVGQGSQSYGVIELDMTNGNVKLDYVTQNDGSIVLLTSGNAELGEGADAVQLLGAGHLDLVGNDADNTLTGNRGNNVLAGGEGRDEIYGGAGSDRLVGGAQGDYLHGGSGRDVLIGGAGYDRLIGGNYHDRVYGGVGNDRLYGNGGNDRLIGGNGHDRLMGGNMNDRLYGNNGGDRLAGGRGQDHLNGGRGDDIMTGGSGRDHFVFNAGSDRIRDFQDDVDTILISSRLTDATNASQVLDSAELIDGSAVIYFDGGHQLTIDNVDSLDILRDDITIL